MASQYDGLLEAAYNTRSRRVELKAIATNMAPADFLSGEPVEEGLDVRTLYQHAPWLFRGVDLRCNGVASVPFVIMRGEKEVDNSATWTNAVGFLPDPGALLWRIEAALTIWRTAYLWRDRNTRKALGLRYLYPGSIEPVIDEVQGLTGFKRNLGTRVIQATTDDIVYFWGPDPYVELGPPEASPVMAALAAAGVLYNVDAFAAAFFKRGAIGSWILTTESTNEKEKERLKSWWQRAVGGINNAFNANVFSALVKPVKIGEGLESLANNTLTADKRADIATALGIPDSLLFSQGAGGLGGGGVATQDDLHFYDKTVVPECRFIQGVLNTQVFTPLGLRLDFKPETLDVFQEDENARAAAFGAYVTAGLPRSLVAQMLGIELPEGWEYDDLDPEEPAPIADGSTLQAQPGDDVNAEVDAIVEGLTKDARQELYQWRRWATKRAGGDLTGFHVNGHLPTSVSKAISADLAQAQTRDEVSAAFDPWLDAPQVQPAAQSAQAEALVDALRAVTEALLKDA